MVEPVGRLFAVIPAAGHSRRMGRPKLALPLGGRPIIEHVVSALREGGTDYVLVVLGPHVADLAIPASAAGAECLVLPEPTTEMRATVGHGLHHLEQTAAPTAHDAWLLTPADHPVLRPEIVRLLRHAWVDRSDRSIFVPIWQGRRGHPTLFRWQHAPSVRRQPPDEGLNAYVRLHAADVLEVPAPGPHVLTDLDTPEDYARLIGR